MLDLLKLSFLLYVRFAFNNSLFLELSITINNIQELVQSAPHSFSLFMFSDIEISSQYKILGFFRITMVIFTDYKHDKNYISCYFIIFFFFL